MNGRDELKYKITGLADLRRSVVEQRQKISFMSNVLREAEKETVRALDSYGLDEGVYIVNIDGKFYVFETNYTFELGMVISDIREAQEL